jgi:hypothetical protein
VKSHIDDDLWQEAACIEDQEKIRIQDAANQWSSMTDDDAPRWAEFQSLREDNPLLWLAVSDPDSTTRNSIISHLLEPLPNAGEMA